MLDGLPPSGWKHIRKIRTIRLETGEPGNRAPAGNVSFLQEWP
jgi:hypothetical protein